MFWYETGNIAPLTAIDCRKIVCFDCETTGLSPRRDEILQIAVVRGDGEVLLNRLIKPSRHTIWPDAQKVHGISPNDVARAAPISELTEEVTRLFSACDLLIGFNIAFDESFLARAGIQISCGMRFDVMKEFAPVMKKRNEWGEYVWPSLKKCAKHYDVLYCAHDALSDAQATLQCYFKMINDDGSNFRSECCIPYLEIVSSFARRHGVKSN